MTKIRAVIPAAGLGTRFLPLTKAQPKEMLPVVNKPTIQWVVEEADIGIIIGKHKESIKNHFLPSLEYEKALLKSGKLEELSSILELGKIANISFIFQEEQKGLGHAIQCAEEFVGDNPFAVLLGDTICQGTPNCTKGLIDIFLDKKTSVFAVEEIKRKDTRRYGIVSGERISSDIMLVDELVEKPEPEAAPSLLGILGRYIFTPDIFNHQKSVEYGKGGEIQLTDAMQALAKESNLYSWKFTGKRYDIGTMEDWLYSHLELLLQSDYRKNIKEIIEKCVK